MTRAFGLPFLCAAILKLIHDICQFIGPIMLREIIHFLGDEEADIVLFLAVYYLVHWLYLLCYPVFLCIAAESVSPKLLLSLLQNRSATAFELRYHGVQQVTSP